MAAANGMGDKNMVVNEDNEVSFNTNDLSLSDINFQYRRIQEALDSIIISNRNIEESVNKANDRVTELSNKIDHFQNEIEGLAKCVATNESQIKTQDSKIDKVQTQVNSLFNKDSQTTLQKEAVDKKINDLNKTIVKLQTAVNDAEQYGRRNMIDITGVPRQNQEDTDEIVTRIAAATGSEVTKRDIEISHRTSTVNEASIIVKFYSRKARNNFWESRKNLKGKTVSDILEGTNSTRKIFLNESLTSKNGAIFKAARNKLKDNFKFIWTRHGVVFARKDSNAEKILIKSLDDLNRITIITDEDE